MFLVSTPEHIITPANYITVSTLNSSQDTEDIQTKLKENQRVLDSAEDDGMITTSAKEVMFLQVFVCLSVFLCA